MLRWIGRFLASSIGRKALMAATGLLLVGYLVEHLIGNVKLYEDESGAAFNEYVRYLQSFGWLLAVAEVALAALFLGHIVVAIQVTLENWSARKDRYAVRNLRGAATLGSLSMHLSGAGILGFLVKHLYDFRFDARFSTDPAALVQRTLAQPSHAVVYLVASLLVGLHLSHGFRSAFQSLGVSHPKWTPWIEGLGRAIAVVLALGFASFPLYFLVFRSD
jgi:succinate dehydrogenase / fumarate reductase cytochrome b subunit